MGDFGAGALNITNGGHVNNVITSNSVIANRAGSTGTVTVTGDGSQWYTKSLNVGGLGHGTLNITGRGKLLTENAVIGVETGSVGEVTIDGDGSTWTNSGIIVVSSFAPGTGTLIVTNGGTVSSAGGIIVRVLGTLRGDGQIIGNVSNVGVVAPGNSPGTLHIDGNYTQAGKLQIEIGGTTPGSQFDMLDITGAATLDGTLEVSLIDGFTPSVGDVFEIVHADGGVFGGFDTFSLPTVPGRSWAFVNTSVSFFLHRRVRPGPRRFQR